MSEKIKPWMIAAASVAALVLVYMVSRPKKTPIQPTPDPQDPQEGGGGQAGGGCPAGQVPCKENPGKCYDPNVSYIVNPCSEIY